MNEVDMRPTYYRKSGIPIGLQSKSQYSLPGEIEKEINDILTGTYSHKIISLCGLTRGKTTAAAALGCAWIETQKSQVHKHTPVLFLPVRQLCYQNRTTDRGNRDEGLTQTIQAAARADVLILDGVFSYLTQNDDLLLQAIYDSRQHSMKTTIVTSAIEDPTDCAGSILYRIVRDAKLKVVF